MQIRMGYDRASGVSLRQGLGERVGGTISNREESFITDDARALLGQRLGEPQSSVVSQREMQRYAHAVGDDSPLYFDAAYARAAG